MHLPAYSAIPQVVYEEMGLDRNDQTMSYVVVKNDTGPYEVILVPRNRQRMTRIELHSIKKEFVGIMEMAGYELIPSRLLL